MRLLSSKVKRASAIGGTALIVAGAAGFLLATSPAVWSLTRPARDVAAAGQADLENGKTMFFAGDCATCHKTPGQEDELRLGGGRALDTEFGVFSMPNISPHPEDGIGDWTLAEFTRSMREGVSPGGWFGDGQNLYPAFPYTSYQRMTANDVRDLFAYIKTLEPVAGKAPDHDLKFPYNVRRGVGVWRLAFLDGEPLDPFEPAAAAAPAEDDVARGHYLVEGPGHCAECHSPRTFIGTIREGMRYAGGPNPEGTGYYPNITPDETGIGFWSKNSIGNYLKTGISPINKVAGGDMADVVHNTKQITDADRHAMAAYLKTIPPIEKPAPGMPLPNRTTELVMLPEPQAKVAELPTATPDEIEAAETVYIAHTKPFYTDSGRLDAGGEEDGKFLGGAELKVMARDGDRMQVRLDGWQMSGADPVFYAMQGQRIIQAVLGDEAIARVEKGERMVDPDTEQEWVESSLDVWMHGEGVSTELPELWSYSSEMFNASCATCHALPATDHFLANQWIGNLNAMKRFTSLTDDQYRLLLAYLQNHAKDTAPGEEAH